MRSLRMVNSVSNPRRGTRSYAARNIRRNWIPLGNGSALRRHASWKIDRSGQQPIKRNPAVNR